MASEPRRARLTESNYTPPHSVPAEQAVIGGLLEGANWGDVADIIKAEDFFRPAHQWIFEAIGALATSGKPYDAVTVSEQLQRVGKLQEAGGLAYLGQIARDTPTAANVRAYAEIVAEKSRLRRRQSLGFQIAEDASAPGADSRQIDQKLMAALESFAEAGSGGAGEGWPEPVNLFAELSAAPYHASEVPVELGEYPRLYAAQTGIDVSIMLGAAVTCAAAAIPDQIQLCADSNSSWFAQPRLWMLNIAPPGAGKSPGQRSMIEPLWKLHGERDEQWRADTKEMNDDEARPPRPRVVIGDATLEALSEVLADNPNGVLVATDEFDAWLGALDQYRSGGGAGRDRGEWLRLFDGGPHSIERVRRGTVLVKNWGVSILTATTPAAMRRLARQLPEDGLIQRFLIVLAQRQQLSIEPTRAGEIEAAKTRYAETIRRLHALKPGSHNGVVQLSFEARRRFAEWRAENLGLQETFGAVAPALEGHIAKYPTLALRLAHTFHAARIVNLQSPEARHPEAYPVPLETMELALAFLKRAGKHAFAFYLGQTASEPYELARSLARLVLSRRPDENAAGLQRREMIRRVVAFRDAAEHAQGAALQVLEDLGWVRQQEGGYRKAHATRFAVNPMVHERFAKLATHERERRTILRERIAESVDERRADRGPA